MPNGTPYCTGFKSLSGTLTDQNSISSPTQTVSGGLDWSYGFIESLSVGANHSAAIKTDGTLWLWGNNTCGKLGDNTQVFKSSPVQTISSGTNWKQVALGCEYSAAIKTDGTLWLWGDNVCGSLGDNTTTPRLSPVQTVSQGTNWKQVSSGSCLSAAVKTDGTLWLWGAGSNGRLGNNSTISRSSPVQTVSTGNNWKQFDAGIFGTSAAVKTDGTLWLWGSNGLGQLGTNSTPDQSSPVQTVSTGNNWKQVSVGLGHSAAVKTDGTLWLWGGGSAGQLGNNTINNVSSPVQTASTGNNWKQVSLGNANSGAVKTDGTLWMWSCNVDGSLGTNSRINQSSPVQTVSSGTNWKQVSLGLSLSSAIKTDGTLWLWGTGLAGRLGTDSTIDQSSPVQTVSSGTNWTSTDECAWCSFSAAPNHSAAIKNDGTLWLWGNGASGKLGNVDSRDQSSPVQTVSSGTNWKQVSVGTNNSASIKTDGTLWVWGDNSVGQLGDETIDSQNSPAQTVTTGTNWLQVTVGTQHIASVKTDGTLWLWGEGSSGQLGTNSTITVSSPVQTVTTGTNWKQVSSQGNFTSAIKTDGTLWLWGLNCRGQLGDNSLVNQSSPVQTVSQGNNWKQVSSNSLHSAAIKTDGTLWLWGSGAAGRLGTNSTINQSSPVQTITTGTNWKQVSSGTCHIVSVKTDGTLWLWGSDVRGQLGDSGNINESSPVQTVTSGTNWNQAVAGENHTMALDFNDALYVWGDNTKGQLGCDRTVYTGSFTDLGLQLVDKDYLIDVYPNLVPQVKAPALWMWGSGVCGVLGTNSITNQSSPVQTISNGTNWKEVSVGGFNSGAIKTDGTLWTWGSGTSGALGDNTFSAKSSPVQTVSTGNNWKQVSNNGNCQCVLYGAIKTDGTLWLWGHNSWGGLGNNTTINRSSPVQTVSTGTNWKQVSAEVGVVAAIKTDGTLWLWGYGENLGINSTISRSSPVQTVSTGTNWKQVSAGNAVAAIKTDGTLWLWGNGGCGAMGNNSTQDILSPVQTVSTGTNWKQVSTSGSFYTTAIKTDGTLWLWGFNCAGQLGNNSTLNQSSPIQTITTGNNWKKVYAGGLTASAIKTDGTLWLWGCNAVGQFGANSTVSMSSPVQTISGGTNWKQVSVALCQSAAIREEYDW